MTKMIRNILLLLPYFMMLYLGDKAGQAYRLSEGVEAAEKLSNIRCGLYEAFSSLLPSFHLPDMLCGVIAAIVAAFVLWDKRTNAKKYRAGIEYGSACFGTAKDIAPYIDPIYENNVLLTKTERLTMSNRPKDPKYARNKNVLVIGGSGSGKTRYYVKPQIMQMHSSYVITDPKG